MTSTVTTISVPADIPKADNDTIFWTSFYTSLLNFAVRHDAEYIIYEHDDDNGSVRSKGCFSIPKHDNGLLQRLQEQHQRAVAIDEVKMEAVYDVIEQHKRRSDRRLSASPIKVQGDDFSEEEAAQQALEQQFEDLQQRLKAR